MRLASTGDTTANLWWRLQHGELPTAAPPKAVVILIGTNDLGYTEACFKSQAANSAAAIGTAARWLLLVAFPAVAGRTMRHCM
jgi:lysophospholipase L1-like esterase